MNMKNSLTPDTFAQGVKDCIPTLLGYISIGLAFGIIATTSNLSILEILLLSVLVYAGSSQFIFCGLYTAGAPITVILITIFIVNLRHLLMSLSVAPFLTRYSALRNIAFGSLLTDETYGVAITKLSKEKQLGGSWLDGLNVTAYSCWILSCTIGGIIGKWLPSTENWGLDFALVAMFVALLVLNLVDIAKSKLIHYLKLIVLMGIIMYGLLHILSGHLAVLISTIVVATIGVLTEK